jgi:uncharacterized protein YciI
MASVTPKLYLLKYDYVENGAEKRKLYREAHSAHLQKQVNNGNIILAGIVDYLPTGAVLVFRNLTPNDIEQYAKQDPFVINGIVTKYTIKPYLAVTGDPSLKNDFVSL